MKKILVVMFISCLLTNPARASEFSIKANYFILNPADYNAKIQEVSVGDVYGAVVGGGIGIGKTLNDSWQLDIGISGNYQKKDAIKEDTGGEQTVYGYNMMVLGYGDLGLSLKIKILKGLTLHVGAGPCLVMAYMESANETDKQHSITPMFGGKVQAGLKKMLGKWFIKVSGAYRYVLKSGDLDVSGAEAGIELGKEF